MHIPKILPSEITPRDTGLNRRQFLQKTAGIIGATALGQVARVHAAPPSRKIPAFAKATTTLPEQDKLTPYRDVTRYNNFYEFGTAKDDPAAHAASLVTHPWFVNIEGAVQKTKRIAVEDLTKRFPLEERIYRMRCVEGWSMVIPWVGFPLTSLIKWAEPTGNAKYVQFISLHNEMMFPGQRVPVLDWPYTEALRMDEALHPLAFLAMGLYGEILPNQNGAPLRLVVPWKYGFKGIKSIVSIRFVEQQPLTTWVRANPQEYGFYANVNPYVDHPRWTQSSERRIGDGLFASRRKTLMFNGYAEQVAQLYSGMDLKKYF